MRNKKLKIPTSKKKKNNSVCADGNIKIVDIAHENIGRIELITHICAVDA